MYTNRKLPPDFLGHLKSLATSYLGDIDPIRQSGFGGGPERWRAEREPILDAIETDGDLLDIGCANGYLLESLIKWGLERGIKLTPFGLDLSAGLIHLAMKRLPDYRSNFYIGNVWDWKPPQKFKYVYSLYDCVPVEFLEEYIFRLFDRVVHPGGRLIIGAYGSRSQVIPPFDIKGFIESAGLSITGIITGGEPPITLFVWLDKE
jgi:SAM-dependent methyltransferase